MIGERSIGSNGANSVDLNVKVGWVFMSCKSSMTLCWLNKYEDWHPIKIPYFPDSLKLNFSQMARSLMPRKTWDPIHGEAFLKVVILLGGV